MTGLDLLCGMPVPAACTLAPLAACLFTPLHGVLVVPPVLSAPLTSQCQVLPYWPPHPAPVFRRPASALYTIAVSTSCPAGLLLPVRLAPLACHLLCSVVHGWSLGRFGPRPGCIRTSLICPLIYRLPAPAASCVLLLVVSETVGRRTCWWSDVVGVCWLIRLLSL